MQQEYRSGDSYDGNDGDDDGDGDDDAVDTVSLSREHTTSTKQQPAVWRK